MYVSGLKIMILIQAQTNIWMVFRQDYLMQNLMMVKSLLPKLLSFQKVRKWGMDKTNDKLNDLTNNKKPPIPYNERLMLSLQLCGKTTKSSHNKTKHLITTGIMFWLTSCTIQYKHKLTISTVRE